MSTTTPGLARSHRRVKGLAADPLRRRWRSWRAIAGVVLAVAVTTGVLAAIDIAAIDPTSGGYEPPFSDYVGDPIDWDADTETTAVGMTQRGHVLHIETDCTTGMIRVEAFGRVGFDYRELSDRALAVHDPRGACEARGFKPQF